MHLIILACHTPKLSNTVIVVYQLTLMKKVWLTVNCVSLLFPSFTIKFCVSHCYPRKRPNFRIWSMLSAEYLLSSHHQQVKKKIKWNLDKWETFVLKAQVPSQHVTISAKGYWIVFLESYCFLWQEEAGSIIMEILSFTCLPSSSVYLWLEVRQPSCKERVLCLGCQSRMLKPRSLTY